MAAAEVKWIGLAAFIEAARRQLGDPAWASAVARLPDATRALFAAPPVAIAWVPAEHYFALLDALVEHGGGRTDLVREVARDQVQRDLRGIYRLFVRLASPDFIAQRAASLYGTYWRGNGTLHVERSTGGSLEVVFEGVPRMHTAFVSAQLGGIQAALEATGVAGVRVVVAQTSERGMRVRASWR
jgi:hypothetical protein